MRAWSTRRKRRNAAAVAVAALFHLAILAPLGLIIPRFEALPEPSGPVIEVNLLPSLSPLATDRPVHKKAASTPPAIAGAKPPPQPQAISPPTPTAPIAPASSPSPAPEGATALAGKADVGCAREDLILLTVVEKRKCRDQIDAENARRLRQGEIARATKAVEEARRQRPIDPIPADKRAYYDAVIAARQADQSALAFMQAGRPAMATVNTNIDVGVGYHCSIRFGVNADKVKRPRGLKLGPLPCYVTPPKNSTFYNAEDDIPPP